MGKEKEEGVYFCVSAFIPSYNSWREVEGCFVECFAFLVS